MHDYPTLHTMVKDATKTSPHQVRHLVIVPVDGSKVTVLMQLISGVQTEIGTGAEYEMGQKVDVFRLSWKWRERSSVKIAERTYEKRTEALHC
jgi:hypothetical protein